MGEATTSGTWCRVIWCDWDLRPLVSGITCPVLAATLEGYHGS